ncbi:MAG: PIG-L deacetylase family protein [Acidimicrobiales bacterium]
MTTVPGDGVRLFAPEEAAMGGVLFIAAHPDDIDYACGGTVATLRAAGVEVGYCIATDGEAGGFDRSVARADVSALRRREQTAAATALGVSDIAFLGYPDGRLAPDMALRRDMAAVIRRSRPDVVVVPSPERNWRSIYAGHPDHLAAGEAAIAAVYPDARNPFAHPELIDQGLEPHTVRELWIMGPPSPNLAVDVTERLDQKVAALACHKSQGADAKEIVTMLREWGGGSAQSAGMSPGRLAELFFVLATG